MPDGDCRYGVPMSRSTRNRATTNKLIFVAWSDDNASVKPKMLYASSKDALKKALTGAPRTARPAALPCRRPAPHPRSPGINEEYQATDRGDLDHAEIKKKAGSV